MMYLHATIKIKYPLPPLKFCARFSTIFVCLILSACASPGYYVQAAAGQWQLMHARQDIGELLESEDTDPALAVNLQKATEILSFAEDELGLPTGESYQSYVETGRSAVSWNIVATPEFSLEAKKWCFPVAGCVPYRGYFKQEKAEKFAHKLRAKDLDVAVSPATAYSTLGWFKDPLLDTMIRGSDTRLASTLFHELAHQRLYISGDTSFNEAYASFVELIGVKTWLVEMNKPESIAGRTKLRAARRDFQQLLSSTRNKLSALYQQKLSDTEMRSSKAMILEDLRAQYALMIEKNWQGRDYFAAWMSSDINNAHLALLQSYQGGLCAFSNLFQISGTDMIEFHHQASLLADMKQEDRRKWLSQPCSGIASIDDL
jgi:predicted aminopeptidase